MALRNIRKEEDPILRKKSKPIREIDQKIKILAEDMFETMYEANGVGLAAPQVGILKRMVVIDVGEGPIVMINPVITSKSGEQENNEGCLSIPGKVGCVVRPAHVEVEATNLEGELFTLEAEELFAIAICHEIDHLNGILFTDLAKTIESVE